MSTPEALLADPAWRREQGRWRILGWIPTGLTAGIGYLVVGIRARNAKWMLLSIPFFVYQGVIGALLSGIPQAARGETLPESDRSPSTIVTVVIIVVWVANAVFLQERVNRQWLVWRAHHFPEGAGTRGSAAASARPLSTATAVDAAFASAAAPEASLDINVATAEQLASLPGFDAELAAQVIAARAAGGAFADPAELVTRAGVKPHVYAAIRRVVVAGSGAPMPPASDAPLAPSPPSSGRRLEF